MLLVYDVFKFCLVVSYVSNQYHRWLRWNPVFLFKVIGVREDLQSKNIKQGFYCSYGFVGLQLSMCVSDLS
jgi:hypothetical protein